MSIWTFKARILAGLALCLTAACAVPLPNLGGGSSALAQAELARGDIRLATPQGYCIDSRSLRQRFALIGRCDTLGAEGFFGAWELAIVTVSTAPLDPEDAPVDLAALSAPPGSGEVLRSIDRGGLTLTRLQSGEAGVEGTSDQYWRTGFVLNGHVVSLALYAPDTSGASGDEGARILQDIYLATRRASAGGES